MISISRRNFLGAGALLALPFSSLKVKASEIDEIFNKLDKDFNNDIKYREEKFKTKLPIQNMSDGLFFAQKQFTSQIEVYGWWNQEREYAAGAQTEGWISPEEEKYIANKFSRKYGIKTFPTTRTEKIVDNSVEAVMKAYDEHFSKRESRMNYIATSGLYNNRYLIRTTPIHIKFFKDRRLDIIGRIPELVNFSGILLMDYCYKN